jgi:hypothetical protein
MTMGGFATDVVSIVASAGKGIPANPPVEWQQYAFAEPANSPNAARNI